MFLPGEELDLRIVFLKNRSEEYFSDTSTLLFPYFIQPLITSLISKGKTSRWLCPDFTFLDRPTPQKTKK